MASTLQARSMSSSSWKTKELRSLGRTGVPVSSKKCSAHQYFPPGGVQPTSYILHAVYVPPVPPELGRQAS